MGAAFHSYKTGVVMSQAPTRPDLCSLQLDHSPCAGIVKRRCQGRVSAPNNTQLYVCTFVCRLYFIVLISRTCWECWDETLKFVVVYLICVNVEKHKVNVTVITMPLLDLSTLLSDIHVSVSKYNSTILAVSDEYLPTSIASRARPAKF